MAVKMFGETIKHCLSCRRSWHQVGLVYDQCPYCKSKNLEEYPTSQWEVGESGRVIRKGLKPVLREQLILDFINGPLKSYLLEDDISFGRFKEMINEKCGTNFSYSDLYPSYLFNAQIFYPEEGECFIPESEGTEESE